MPRGHTFHQLTYHFVWATKNREPLLDASMEAYLSRFLTEKCRELGYTLHAVNGTADHIHLLLELPPTACVADVVKTLKGNSAHHINQKVHLGHSLYWQEGYGVLTLRHGEIPRVANYIRNQKEHHAEGKAGGIWERTG